MTVLPADRYRSRIDKPCGLVTSMSQSLEKAEFVGLSPGSSPAQAVYWLDGVLVVLSTQLDRYQAVDDGVSFIARYCCDSHPKDTVDAVLLSIEHVILVHIKSDGAIQRTALLPLFNIDDHLSMDVRDRYSSSYLEKLGHHKALIREEENWMEDEEFHISEGGIPLHASQIGAPGDPASTLFALTHIFDAAARRKMCLSRAANGRLPNEVSADILSHVTDV